MIPADDLKEGLFVAVRYMRRHPDKDVWEHIASPILYRVLGVSLPYVGLEDFGCKEKIMLDTSVFAFEQVRPDLVAALFPESIKRARAAIKSEEFDDQGYRKPMLVMTIK